MKVMQFGFAELDSEHLPHRWHPNMVGYTGNHDNDTTRGWFEKRRGARSPTRAPTPVDSLGNAAGAAERRR